jgi:hypothetical protein
MPTVDIFWTILIFGIGGILVGFIVNQNQCDSNRETSNINETTRDPKKVSVWSRWSIRLSLVGLGLGIFGSISQGYASPKHIGFMIGLGIPFALIFGVIGFIIDFFVRKR